MNESFGNTTAIIIISYNILFTSKYYLILKKCKNPKSFEWEMYYDSNGVMDIWVLDKKTNLGNNRHPNISDKFKINLYMPNCIYYCATLLEEF